jgi:hypothetical protein
MRRYQVLLAGMLMIGTGAYMIFGNSEALPLWFVWLAGPLLWYLGIATAIVGLAVTFFLRPVEAPAREPEIAVLRFPKALLGERPPAGVLHEIPAMGAFIL